MKGMTKNNQKAFQIPDFAAIKVSTKTIIAVTNLVFDLNLLYHYTPITEYVVVQRKRGRKKKTEVIDPNRDIPAGSIISVQNKTNIRGVQVKPKKKESKTYFLNSITIVIILEGGKMINTKVSQNGKFQITGCKENFHFLDCLKYVYQHLCAVQEYTGVPVFTIKPQCVNQVPRVVFNTVMKNIDFKLNFNVQRDKLDTFINAHTDFYSLFEASINTGVNIKMKSTQPHDNILTCLEFPTPTTTKETNVPYSEYLTFLDEKEKKKEATKEKFTTLLIFNSGSCIQSGSGPEMEKVYYKFFKLMMENREKFEEKLEPDAID